MILHIKFVEVLSEIFDNENYKNILFQICSSEKLFIYQIEEQSLLSLLAKNWVNPCNLHLLLHDFSNHVCSDLLWKLDHGSSESR